MANNLAIATRRLGGPGGDSYAERVLSNLEADTLLDSKNVIYYIYVSDPSDQARGAR